ncbi:MAG: DUF1643 domain-containing protein [Phycisphaerales bacterium]|nr:DUF1643 domain-containing protein [Phycisphaerales bacterium]
MPQPPQHDPQTVDRLVSGATFSRCRRYRYALWRVWDNGPLALFIGLNPSTADAERNDPTVRRCIGFARDWGYAGLLVANIFAFRSTDPKGLTETANPVGPRNNHWIVRLHQRADITIAAWGVGGALHNRGRAVLSRLTDPHCLGETKAGAPRHPLYVSSKTRPRLFQPGSIA